MYFLGCCFFFLYVCIYSTHVFGHQGPVLGLILWHDGLALAHLLAQLRHLRPQGRVLLLQEGRPDGDLVLLQAPGVPGPLGCHIVLLASRPVLLVLWGRVFGRSLLFPMREPTPPLLPALHPTHTDSSFNWHSAAGTWGLPGALPLHPGSVIHRPHRIQVGPLVEGRAFLLPVVSLCCSDIQHCLYSCLTQTVAEGLHPGSSPRSSHLGSATF